MNNAFIIYHQLDERARSHPRCGRCSRVTFIRNDTTAFLWQAGGPVLLVLWLRLLPWQPAFCWRAQPFFQCASFQWRKG